MQSISINEFIEIYWDSLSTTEKKKAKECLDRGDVSDIEFEKEENALTLFSQVDNYPDDDYLEICFSKEQMCGYCPCKKKSSEMCVHMLATLLCYRNELKGGQEEHGVSKTINSDLLEWMQEVGEIIERKKEPPRPSSLSNRGQERVLTYLINKGVSHLKYNTLKIHALAAKIKKSGGYAKSNQTKVEWQALLNNPHHAIRSAFTDEDWEILFEASQKGDYQHDTIECNSGEASIGLVKKIIATGRCHHGNIYTPPLKWGVERKGSFDWQLLPSCEELVITLSVSPEAYIFHLDEGCYLFVDEEQGTIGPVTFSEKRELVKKIIHAPPLPIEQTEAFGKILEKKFPLLAKIKPKSVKTRDVETAPKPHLHIDLSPNNWYRAELIAALSFTYDGIDTKEMHPAGDDSLSRALLGGEEVVMIKRDLPQENRYRALINQMPFTKGWGKGEHYTYRSRFHSKEEIVDDFVKNMQPKLKELGFAITYGKDLPIYQSIEDSEWYLETFFDSGGSNDWFGVEMGVMIDGEQVNILPLLKSIYLNKPQMINDENINKICLSAKEGRKKIEISRERLQRLLKAFSLDFENNTLDEKGRLHLSKWAAHHLEEMKLASEKAEMRSIGSEEIYSFAERLKKVKEIPQVTPSKKLASTLRSYQIEGLSWMQFLRQNGLNGILADDMGLGKTIQCLAHIQQEKDEGRLKSPCLIIAPTSLMFNWQHEVEKHTPELKALVFHGSNRHGDFDKIEEHDLILTTYPLIARDKERLLKQHFHMLILDEAQVIKNSRTQAYQAIQQLEASHRLCLSGTPMENHLGELWSLYNFLMPGFLGKTKVFTKLFRTPIEKQGDQEKKMILARRIAPFMLRRTKELVAKELPDKMEIIREIEFDSKQMDLYEMIRIRAHRKMMKEIEKKGIERSQIAVLEALLKLRQVCCDPRLVKSDEKIDAVPSAKLEHLKEMLPSLIEEGRRVLLFSQFTSMLALIEEELAKLEIPYTILTGSTIDRKGPVEAFQNGEVPLMLLSLKAGGVGLNLTAADTVIHYDPWWNPAVETQATDRAHRIGQKNKVFVYKLVSSGTVEEKILQLQKKKKELVSALLESKEGQSLNLTAEELDEVFKPLSY